MIQTHGRKYDGLLLLTQILRYYLLALKDGVTIGEPTWVACDADMFLLQSNISKLYQMELTLNRNYSEMEQSRKYLE